MAEDPVDVMVVGSGMSAVHAAVTLLDHRRSVLMLDAGDDGARHRHRVPDRDFLELRSRDPDQHGYFLGRDFEGIPWGPAAHTLTPPRQYITANSGLWCPLRADRFEGVESLAYGGLGCGWGAGCGRYPDAELAMMGLDPAAMADAYRVVAKRIGVSAAVDDATGYCGAGLDAAQPPLREDNSIAMLHAAARRRSERLHRDGIVVGHVPMAVLTRASAGRAANPYTDMEFWADHGGAVYRPWMTLDALRTRPGFEYRGGWVVLRFGEDGGTVWAEAAPVGGGAVQRYRARQLVLGAGALGSARLVLRSQPGVTRLPLLSNLYSIAVCLHWRMFGRALQRERTSLGQMEMFYDPAGDHGRVHMASLYTYRSLLLFKLIKELPMAMGDGRALMQELSGALVLATFNHPDRPAPGKYCRLEPDPGSRSGDALRVVWDTIPDDLANNRQAERVLARALRRIGSPVIRVQSMAPGSTLHYAGTLPVAGDGRPGTLSANGRLAGTRNVFVVDGSGFRYLPANGHSLTLMANAHRVAGAVARNQD